MPPKKRSSDSAIQSVQRAAAILRCFTKTDSDLGVTTISKELGLHKSTVSRLLSTLQREGYVEQNPETGKYRLGLTLVTLAGIVLDRIDLRTLAQPLLNQLAEATQETVNIAVLSGAECMNIGSAASPRPIQYVGRIGRRTPLHCTAAGKVLLAYILEDLHTLLPETLPRFTQHTIVQRDILEDSLPEIRARGYAMSDQEHQEGLSAIAAPIFDHTGRVQAAVTVSGPTYRMGPEKIGAFADAVRATAAGISAQLGG